MNQIDFNQMELLVGGRKETDEMGCAGVILMGAVLAVATLGWGLFVMGWDLEFVHLNQENSYEEANSISDLPPLFINSTKFFA